MPRGVLPNLLQNIPLPYTPWVFAISSQLGARGFLAPTKKFSSHLFLYLFLYTFFSICEKLGKTPRRKYAPDPLFFISWILIHHSPMHVWGLGWSTSRPSSCILSFTPLYWCLHDLLACSPVFFVKVAPFI